MLPWCYRCWRFNFCPRRALHFAGVVSSYQNRFAPQGVMMMAPNGGGQPMVGMAAGGAAPPPYMPQPAPGGPAVYGQPVPAYYYGQPPPPQFVGAVCMSRGARRLRRTSPDRREREPHVVIDAPSCVLLMCEVATRRRQRAARPRV